MPATPAEANSEMPNWRTESKLISAKPTVKRADQHIHRLADDAHLRHRLARHQIVGDIDAQAVRRSGPSRY